jgi:hypothetical protein
MTKRLLPTLLACSIALASASGGATAPATGVVAPKPGGAAPATGVVPPKPDFSPISVRLRMRLEVIDPTDDQAAGTDSMNSEDEVYYAIAGLPYLPDANAQMKTVKRVGGPDIWEMGSRSAPTLHRTLFKGKSSPLRANSFMLVIAEQDASWVGLLQTLLYAGLNVIAEAADGTFTDASDAEKVVEKLHGEFKVIAERISSQDDQIIGAVAITMKGKHLTVKANPDLHSTVIDNDPTQPVIRLWGSGYKYELKLILEDATVAAPVIHDFIGLEQDGCGGDLWIDTKDGNIQLKKGKRTGFRPKSHEFNWYCDGDENITRASSATDYVIASRASNGGEILWRIFKDYTPAQDLNW